MERRRRVSVQLPPTLASFVVSLPGWLGLAALSLLLMLMLALAMGFSVRLLTRFAALELLVIIPDELAITVILVMFAAEVWLCVQAAALIGRYVFHLFPMRVGAPRRWGCLTTLLLFVRPRSAP